MSQRVEFLQRANDIAFRANARLLGAYRIPDSIIDMLVYWVPSTGKQVLVKVTDDGCWHYVEGGPLWSEMERDFGLEPPADPDLKDYYIVHNGYSVFVKEAAFFEEQGGLTASWGKRWVKVQASSIEHARTLWPAGKVTV